MPFILEGEIGGNINQKPVALGEAVTTIKNTALRFPLASFDSDGTVSGPIITQPANGTVTIVSGNVIEYTPDPDYIGVDEFTFTVADNDGDTSPDGVISVNVIETNQITTQTADDLAAIDVSGLALGTIATVSNDTPDNNGPYSLALDGAITYWSA